MTMLTPYQAQFRWNDSALERLARSSTNLRNVISAKVRTYQGKKNHVVILDLVGTETVGRETVCAHQFYQQLVSGPCPD